MEKLTGIKISKLDFDELLKLYNRGNQKDLILPIMTGLIKNNFESVYNYLYNIIDVLDYTDEECYQITTTLAHEAKRNKQSVGKYLVNRLKPKLSNSVFQHQLSIFYILIKAINEVPPNIGIRYENTVFAPITKLLESIIDVTMDDIQIPEGYENPLDAEAEAIANANMVLNEPMDESEFKLYLFANSDYQRFKEILYNTYIGLQKIGYAPKISLIFIKPI